MPLATAADAVGAAWAQPVVRFGAAIASLGALLALIAGVGRTTLAMARNGDLPRRLASVDERFSVPDRAELAIGAAVVALVLATDLRGAIGFSSFGVLVYYAVANAAAFTQSREHRRWPRGLNVVGAIACLALVAALPRSSIVAGAAVLAAGLAARAVVMQTRKRRREITERPTVPNGRARM
jgi:APA family basic amino acid/polyamine antiporter